jgi:predicted amidohydrolase YtcJ
VHNVTTVTYGENIKGFPAKSKLANFIIDKDLTKIPAEIILDARVRLTVLGGKMVYKRK